MIQETTDPNVRIVYVEDDEVLASVTTRSLTRRGYHVTHYPSISDVKAYTANSSFHWALLDLKLDEGSSLELVEFLLHHHPNIKIVILTAYASIATAVQAIKLGATNYLSKPATIDQILNAFINENTCSCSADIEESVIPFNRIEWEHIQQVLSENNGNISATARQLKMHRRTLQRKLSKKPHN
jgi:two-component system response regulator RegA